MYFATSPYTRTSYKQHPNPTTNIYSQYTLTRLQNRSPTHSHTQHARSVRRRTRETLPACKARLRLSRVPPGTGCPRPRRGNFQTIQTSGRPSLTRYRQNPGDLTLSRLAKVLDTSSPTPPTSKSARTHRKALTRQRRPSQSGTTSSKGLRASLRPRE
jgi:hypothetical protein